MFIIDNGATPPGAPQAPEQPETEASSPELPPSVSPLPFQLPKATRRPIALGGDDCGRLVIHAIRQETGLSIGQIAKRLGVSRQAIECYQYRRRNPSAKWLARVMAAVGGRVVLEFPPTS